MYESESILDLSQRKTTTIKQYKFGMKKTVQELLNKWLWLIALSPAPVLVVEPIKAIIKQYTFMSIAIYLIFLLMLLCIGFRKEIIDYYSEITGKNRIKKLEFFIREQIAEIERIQREIKEVFENFTQQPTDNQDIIKIIKELDNLNSKAKCLVKGAKLIDRLKDDKNETRVRDKNRIKERNKKKG